MTLVVARIRNGRIAIGCDTLLTEHGVCLPRARDVIKLRMLPGGICAAFSNSPEQANLAFDEFIDRYRNGANYKQAVDFFSSASRGSGNDFIVAFSRVPRLVRIDSGGTEQVRGSCWIGDYEAFRRFRHYEAQRGDSELREAGIPAVFFMDEMPGSPAQAIMTPLRRVIAASDIASVGGFPCIVSSRPDGFRFSAYSETLLDPPVGAEGLPPSWHPGDVGGSGENLGFTFAQFSTNLLGCNMVAFYYAKGRVLYGFDDGHLWGRSACRIVRNVDPLDIERHLRPMGHPHIGWLVGVISSSVPQSWLYEDPEQGDTDGPRFHFMCEANTFEKYEGAVAALNEAPQAWRMNAGGASMNSDALQAFKN